jgi:hypothetical protein
MIFIYLFAYLFKFFFIIQIKYIYYRIKNLLPQKKLEKKIKINILKKI